MEDAPGFDVVYEKVRAIGTEAYRKYGCNIIAIVTDKQPSKGGSNRAQVYEGPGVAGFFGTRVEGGQDMIVKSLKYYVSQSQGRADLPTSPVTNSSSQSTHSDRTYGSEYSDDDENDYNSSNESEPESDGKRCAKDRPYFVLVRQALVEHAVSAGLPMKAHSFPWNRLTRICAERGIYINNYPHGVRSPFCTGETGNGASRRNMSLSGLRPVERQMLLHALMKEKVHPMRFVKVDNPTSIQHSRFPVLIFAPPPPGSPYLASKRYFLDGTSDHDGHSRLNFWRKGNLEGVRSQEDYTRSKPEKQQSNKFYNSQYLHEIRSADPEHEGGMDAINSLGAFGNGQERNPGKRKAQTPHVQKSKKRHCGNGGVLTPASSSNHSREALSFNTTSNQSNPEVGFDANDPKVVLQALRCYIEKIVNEIQ